MEEGTREGNQDELTTELTWEDIRQLKGYLSVEGFEYWTEEIWILSSCARYAESLKVWRPNINVIKQQDAPVSDLLVELEMRREEFLSWLSGE